MTQVSRYKLSDSMKLQLEDLFFTSISKFSDKNEVQSFLKEFLTKNELAMLSKRVAIGILLSRGIDHRSISRELKVSTSTVTSYSLVYKYGSGYKKVIDAIERKLKNQKELLSLAESFASIGAVGGAKSASWFNTRNELRKKKNNII